MRETRAPRVLTAPVLAENPYQALLGAAMRRRGARLTAQGRLGVRAALRSPRQLDVLHLHWIEHLTGSARADATLAGALVRAAGLLTGLALLRARGVRVVWTVHNVGAHGGRQPALDLAVGRAVARLAHRVHVHTDAAARAVRAQYGRPAVVARHPGFFGVYPPSGLDRAAVRAGLGVAPDARVVLAFGQLRRDKDPLGLLAAFRSCEATDLRLVIAGRALSDGLADEVARAARADPRVLLVLGHAEDARVAELHLAADAAVVPYGDVFSSGALILALTLGLPVVTPAVGAATELGGPPAVRLYAAGELAAALARVEPLEETVRAAATRAAEQAGSWDTVAEAILSP